jgi:pyridoxine 4-dehydrogenase
MPVLEECYARGIAFVPFFPLGTAFGRGNAVLGSKQVVDTAARVGCTTAQVALAWLAVADIELDAQARDLLASVA